LRQKEIRSSNGVNTKMKKRLLTVIISILAITGAATAKKQPALLNGSDEGPDLSRGTVPSGMAYTIKIQEGLTAVVINSSDETITVGHTQEPLQQRKPSLTGLPVGKYRIDYWTIERKDQEGNLWQLKGRLSGRKARFLVSESQPAAPAIGEPIISILSAAKYDSGYGFGQYLKGRLGESIEITRNGERPDAPKLVINNQDGSYSETFDFKYG
jgi:hypothetical protein